MGTIASSRLPYVLRVVAFVGLIVCALLAPNLTSAQALQNADAAAANVRTNTGVPRLVQLSTTLKDSAARPVSGVASVTFAIYAEQDGGTALWSETQNVLADSNGRFNTLLGGATPAGVPDDLFATGQSRWLGVTIARQPEMPRVLMASVPYALKAADADTLGGIPASEYVTTKSLATLRARATAPIVLSDGNTTVIATPSLASEPVNAATPEATPQATPSGMGTTNFIPIWTSTSALGNSKIFQDSTGNIGIGTTAPTQTLDVNGNSIFRGSFQLPPGHEATAASGFESHSFQFEASAFSSSTHKAVDHSFGFRAEPLGNNTNNPTAKLDLFFGVANNTLTDTGFSWSNTGVVTFAPGQTFSGSSMTLTGTLNLPNTTNATTGVITFGGVPFVSNYGTQSTYIGGSAGGPQTGPVNPENEFNTGVGYHTLFANVTGLQNAAVGSMALAANNSGNENVALGYNALAANTTGSDNTAVGQGAGAGNVTGTQNTFVGFNAGATVDGLTNATAIGAFSQVSESNAVILGGTGAHAVNVGIGTTTPRTPLEIATGSVALSAPVLTLTDTQGTASFGVAEINFYPFVTGASNQQPGVTIAADSDPAGSADLWFYAPNPDGSTNVTLKLDYQGNLTVGGNLNVTGTLTKGGGSFKIDDPIAPAEKYLSHSFVESPDMKNIYDGVVVLDANGHAVVQLPTWFSALNRDYRYQLTSIGASAPRLYISREIHKNRFSIAGGKPGLKVSWQVTGIRHDAWANANRIPTEEVKPASEQGKYLYPELFGASADRRITPVGAIQPTPPSKPEPATRAAGIDDDAPKPTKAAGQP